MVNLRLRDLREDADVKQTEMASLLKCSQTCYSKYELQQRDIPSDALVKLSDFFNTSTDYILGRTEIKIPYPKK